jgi:hypothetical protein
MSNKEEKFIYCSFRNCPYIDCLRHDRNIPFNTLILRDNFKPDKNGNCRDKVT